LPLIVASERPQWILLTFDLGASDLPYHAGFPLLVDNAMAWFGRDRLALRRMPGMVEIPIAGAQIRTTDGQPIPSLESLNGTVFEAPDPGLYVASRGDVSQYVAVNFTNRQYSDINVSRVRDNKSTQASIPVLRRELWYYMLIAAMILIGVEWFTYHRRIRSNAPDFRKLLAMLFLLVIPYLWWVCMRSAVDLTPKHSGFRRPYVPFSFSR
jgi:hypothetical protein